MTSGDGLQAGRQPHKRRTLQLAAAFVVVALVAGGAAATMVLDHFGVGLHGNPLRLFGLVEAQWKAGCYPAQNPMACHVAGRAWRLQSSGAAWSARADGPNGYRFELRSGDRWAKDVRLKSDVERVELSDLRRMPSNQDIWLGFTINIEPGPRTTAEWVNLGQAHNTPDPGEKSASPPWVQRFFPGERLQVWVRHTDQDPLRDNPEPITLSTLEAFPRGRPSRFVYQFRFSRGADGLARVWRDGVLIGDYHGPLGYPDKRGPYFKFGIYRSPAAETLIVRYSDVQLGSEPLMPLAAKPN